MASKHIRIVVDGYNAVDDGVNAQSASWGWVQLARNGARVATSRHYSTRRHALRAAHHPDTEPDWSGILGDIRHHSATWTRPPFVVDDELDWATISNAAAIAARTNATWIPLTTAGMIIDIEDPPRTPIAHVMHDILPGADLTLTTPGGWCGPHNLLDTHTPDTIEHTHDSRGYSTIEAHCRHCTWSAVSYDVSQAGVAKVERWRAEHRCGDTVGS